MDSYAYRLAVIKRLPALWISIAFLLGIALGTFWAIPPIAGAVVSGLIFLVGRLVLPRLSRQLPLNEIALWMLLGLSAMAFSLGLARIRIALSPPTSSDLDYYNASAQPIQIIGQIQNIPESGAETIEFVLGVEKIRFVGQADWISVAGGLRVWARSEEGWAYGDRVFLRGTLESPTADVELSYLAFLQREGIQSQIYYPQLSRLNAGPVNPFFSLIYSFHVAASKKIQNMYPEPAASLLSGILLGDESGLSDSLKEDFNETGTRHIIAISGFNITIIAALFLSLFRRWLGPLRGNWLALFGVIVYTILVGADAAVLRAAVMAGVALVARQSGRRNAGLISIFLSAALMAAFTPLIIWDIGFQLSFSATLGIIVFGTRFGDWTLRQLSLILKEDQAQQLLPWITESILLTLAAQLTTLPILLYYFHRFSLSSFPANLLILAVQPSIMILGGLSVLVGFIFFPLGQFVAWITWPFLAYTIRIVQFFARQPWASNLVADVPLQFVFAWYMLIGWLASPKPEKPTDQPQYTIPRWLFGSLAIGTLSVWLLGFSRPNGELQLTILEDRGELALLIQSPEGRNTLLALSELSESFPSQIHRELPFFNRSIDWLVVGGGNKSAPNLELLERLAPAHLALFPDGFTPFQLEQLYLEAREVDIGVTQIEPKQTFALSPIASLVPVGQSESGSLFLVEQGDFSMLVAHSMDSRSVQKNIRHHDYQNLDLILLSDVAMETDGFWDWVGQQSPLLVVTNSAPLSAAEELEAQATTISLIQSGWLRLSTNGRQLNLESQHSIP